MRFGSDRDVSLMVNIGRELLHDVIEQEVLYHKLSLEDTDVNLYGESLSKSYWNAVKLHCLITRGDQIIDIQEFGPDLGREASFAFIRQDLSDVSVVKEAVPPTVIIPLSVIESPAVTARLPPMVDAAILRAVVPLSMVAFPDEPVVLKLTAPDNAFVDVFRVIVPLLALVVKDDVPDTARATVSVMFPVVAVTLRFPPTAPSVEALI